MPSTRPMSDVGGLCIRQRVSPSAEQKRGKTFQGRPDVGPGAGCVKQRVSPPLAPPVKDSCDVSAGANKPRISLPTSQD